MEGATRGLTPPGLQPLEQGQAVHISTSNKENARPTKGESKEIDEGFLSKFLNEDNIPGNRRPFRHQPSYRGGRDQVQEHADVFSDSSRSELATPETPSPIQTAKFQLVGGCPKAPAENFQNQQSPVLIPNFLGQSVTAPMYVLHEYGAPISLRSKRSPIGNNRRSGTQTDLLIEYFDAGCPAIVKVSPPSKSRKSNVATGSEHIDIVTGEGTRRLSFAERVNWVAPPNQTPGEENTMKSTASGDKKIKRWSLDDVLARSPLDVIRETPQ